MVIFSINASRAFGEKIATHCGVELAPHEEREFEDGEHKIRPLLNVRGCDVYVISSLYGEPNSSPNDKIIRLLNFIAALKDAGAARVNAVTPYLAYARKDRRTKPRDPVTSRYLAKLFEAMGTAAIWAMEVHNLAAFENAFHICRPEHVPSAPVFTDHFLGLARAQPVSVVSPDPGGIKRAELFREVLERKSGRTIGKAFVDKHRSAGVIAGNLLAGDVKGCAAIIMDDLISSGSTMIRAANACRDAGAIHIIAAAAHGLFMKGADTAFSNPVIDEVVITDTVQPFRLRDTAALAKLKVISAAPFFAEVIKRAHTGACVEDLVWE